MGGLTTYHSKPRRLQILLHKSVPFVCSNGVSDPGGRYLILPGRVYDTPVLLVKACAPDWYDPDFFRQFFSNFPDMSSHFLILGADFNC